MKKKIGDYVLDEKLGAGAFGEVFRAKNIKNDEILAIKVLNKAKMTSKVLSYLDREVDILQRVNSEYVVKLKDLKVTEHNYYLVFEYCNGGDLSNYRKFKGGRVNEKTARRLIKQIVSGLVSLYSLNGIHRDIKLSNVLLHYPTKAYEESDEGIAKLCDFGFARLIGDPSVDLEVPIEMSFVGTPLNMSPEMIKRTPYTIKSDLWSLGTITYELLCGEPPFFGLSKEHLVKTIEFGQYRIPKKANLSCEALDFISSCMQNNPDDRIGWKQLSTHPFIGTDTITEFNIEKFKQTNPNSIIENSDHLVMTTKVKYNFEAFYTKKPEITIEPVVESPPPKDLIALVPLTEGPELHEIDKIPIMSSPEPVKNIKTSTDKKLIEPQKLNYNEKTAEPEKTAENIDKDPPKLENEEQNETTDLPKIEDKKEEKEEKVTESEGLKFKEKTDFVEVENSTKNEDPAESEYVIL